jgi:hypothetical protein
MPNVGDRIQISGMRQSPPWSKRFPRVWEGIYRHAFWLARLLMSRQPLQIFEVTETHESGYERVKFKQV